MSDSVPPIRSSAIWQQGHDDRILEVLDKDGWLSPYQIANEPSVWLPTFRVKRRLRLLADAELVAPFDDDFDLYHITTDGRLYLDGDRDQSLHPHPFCYGLATAPLF